MISFVQMKLRSLPIAVCRSPSVVRRSLSTVLNYCRKKNSGANYEKRFKIFVGSHGYPNHRSM